MALKFVLKTNCRNYPRASERIDRGEFVIYDSAVQRDIDLGRGWKLWFKPGQRVHVSMTFHSTTTVNGAALCSACGTEGSKESGIEAVWQVR
jgi:hypothetical protein